MHLIKKYLFVVRGASPFTYNIVGLSKDYGML